MWTIAGARAKTGRVHRVALSEAAIAVLCEARARGGGDGVRIFRGARGGPVSEGAFLEVITRSTVNVITDSPASDHWPERSDAGVARERPSGAPES